MNLVKLLHNPIAIRIFFGAVVSGLLFLIAVIIMRKMRMGLMPEPEGPQRISEENNTAFLLAAYEGTIKQFKQREQDLKKLNQQESDRATAAEVLTEAILTSMNAGAVFFDTRGLVKQASPSAKTILGYASPFGLQPHELFRGVSSSVRNGSSVDFTVDELVERLQHTFREGADFCPLEADYQTPAGECRRLRIGAAPVRSKNGALVGASCVITIQTHSIEN